MPELEATIARAHRITDRFSIGVGIFVAALVLAHLAEAAAR